MSSTYNKIIAKGIESIAKREGLTFPELHNRLLNKFKGPDQVLRMTNLTNGREEALPHELEIICSELNTNPIKLFFVGLAKLRGEDREKKERDLIDIALKLASRLAIHKEDIPAFEKISLKELGDEYSNEELEIVRELAVKLAQTEAIKKLQNI